MPRRATGVGATDLVLDGALAVTLGAKGVVVASEVVVRAGRIEEVRSRRARLRPRSTVVDCRDRVLLPGMVNAHLHSEFLLLKGLLEERRLREWEESDDFNRAWARIRDPASVGHVRHALRASYLEALLGGTTSVAEFNCADDATPASLIEMERAGIRGTPTLDLARRDRFPRIAARGCLYAIDDEEGLTEDELHRACDLRRDDPDARLTMHAAETAERMVLIRARLGRTTVDLLDAHGLLGPHLVLSHAVHVTRAEIERLAQTRTAVVASPVAEMKLGDGVSPVAEMLARGVTVALGTDAAVCNNGCDMFGEMKALALIQKVTHGAHVLTAEQALVAATLSGARALGMSDRLGTIDPGKEADLVLLDARSPRLTPLVHDRRGSNVMANLVHAATASDVTDVVVRGAFVVRGGVHVSLDRAKVLADLQASALALRRGLGARRRLSAGGSGSRAARRT